MDKLKLMIIVGTRPEIIRLSAVIKKCDKYILHSMGKANKEETVFTRYEFEKMLNTLHAFYIHGT